MVPRRFFYTLILIFSFQLLIAQEVEIFNAQPVSPKKIFKSTSVQDTLELPFFDDFSAPKLNPGLWRTNGVTINFTSSVNPPSLGAAMFDAVDLKGDFYAQNYNTSTASDTLTSSPINLYYPDDQTIYLSFFYEPKGLLDKPEPQDSLVLQFYSPTRQTWSTVWRDTGISQEPGNLGFKLVMINISDSNFLQKGFRFRFINYTSLGSSSVPSLVSDCDYWFVDYIYLNRNRYAGDTVFADVALQYPISFKLDDYTSVPYKHYEQSGLSHNLTVKFRNNDAVNRTIDSLYVTFLNDSTAQVLDTLFLGSYSFPPEGNYFVQANDINYRLPAVGPVVFDLKTKLVTSQNEPAENDTVTSRMYLTSFYSYDDGTSEAGYGLVGDGTYQAKVAARFYTYKTDTLRGLMVYFNKTYKQAQPHYFYIMVWENDANYGIPGKLLCEQMGAEVDYGHLNSFQVYWLDTPVVVTDTFYIGWKKTDEQLMNVGLDLNNPVENYKFYNIDGTWRKSQIQGNLMIRPIFGTYTGFVTKVNDKVLTNLELKIFPNPAREYCTVSTTKQGNIQIFNLDGHLLMSKKISGRTSFDISNLPPGIYLIRFTSHLKSITKRLIKY